MKLMTRVTKWAVTIHGSGDSQRWAGFCAGQALTQSTARETEQNETRRRGQRVFFKVRQGDIRWQRDADSKRNGGRRGAEAGGRGVERGGEIVSK